MLEDLKINNGELSYHFSPLSYNYSVILDNMDDSSLEIEYRCSDDVLVDILNNDLILGNNEVIIKLTKDEQEEEYHLHVYKEEKKDALSVASTDINNEEKIEVISPYAAPGIGGGCFLLILILYVILFAKRKKCK